MWFNSVPHHTGGIIAAGCQVEVVTVAIVTGVIVHLVTRKFVKQKPIPDQDRSGTELGPPRTDNSSLTEPVGFGTSNGEDVQMQPNPAYNTVPDYL